MRKEERRGLSPVIATVMLIAMVVVLGLIIFLWFRGFTEESVTKFGGTNIKIVCGDVDFESGYSSSTGEIFLSNIGNVPIYAFKLKVEELGGHETLDIEDITGSWPSTGLDQGGVFTEDVSSSIGTSATKITVIPVLRGSSDKGPRIYTCEDRYGDVILI